MLCTERRIRFSDRTFSGLAWTDDGTALRESGGRFCERDAPARGQIVAGRYLVVLPPSLFEAKEDPLRERVYRERALLLFPGESLQP